MAAAVLPAMHVYACVLLCLCELFWNISSIKSHLGYRPLFKEQDSLFAACHYAAGGWREDIAV